MTEPSDLERHVERALGAHGRRFGSTHGSLDDVFERVDWRRRHRRRIAAIGSVAAVGVGVLGVAALSVRGRDVELPAAGGGDASATTAVFPVFTTTTNPVTDQMIWACSSPVEVPGGDPELAYFRDCFTVPDPAAVDGLVPVTTISVLTYQVVAGDSLARIAALFGLTIDELIAYNPWPDGVDHPLLPGDVVMIPGEALDDGPTPTTTVGVRLYEVQAGDTVATLRDRWGLPRSLLTQLNGWAEDEHTLTAGELIAVPADVAEFSGLLPATTTIAPPPTTAP